MALWLPCLFLYNPIPEKQVLTQVWAIIILGHPGQSWFVWGWAPDPSWALHYPFLGFQTFFKNQKLNNNHLSISVVKTVRNASWSGFPISEESQFGVEEIEAKMQREGEMTDRERGSWWPLSPWFYMFLRLSKVGFYGIRPWDGVWGAGYLLGSNTHRKEGRKQGRVEGEIELQRRSKKALADPTESSAAYTAHWNCPAWTEVVWSLYSHSDQSLKVGCPGKGVFLGETAL